MQNPPRDNIAPTGAWTFNEDVTSVFDDMLARSIPQYEAMRDACASLALRFAKRGTTIGDLGCSRGEAIAQLVDRLGATCRFIGLDISEPMLHAARQRFGSLIDVGVIDIRRHDLRTPGLPFANASVILAVLTIQFTPIEYRLRILQDIYDALAPGGAFLLVEKVLGGSAEIDGHMVSLYYDLKRRNGYSQEQIDRKRLSLEGVLVPVTAAWNEEMLKQTGFTNVDCFWRWFNFAGWLAVKR